MQELEESFIFHTIVAFEALVDELGVAAVVAGLRPDIRLVLLEELNK